MTASEALAKEELEKLVPAVSEVIRYEGERIANARRALLSPAVVSAFARLVEERDDWEATFHALQDAMNGHDGVAGALVAAHTERAALLRRVEELERAVDDVRPHMEEPAMLGESHYERAAIHLWKVRDLK